MHAIAARVYQESLQNQSFRNVENVVLDIIEF